MTYTLQMKRKDGKPLDMRCYFEEHYWLSEDSWYTYEDSSEARYQSLDLWKDLAQMWRETPLGQEVEVRVVRIEYVPIDEGEGE